MFSKAEFSEEDVFWRKHFANLKQWYNSYWGAHTHLSVPWYTLIPYLIPHRFIYGGVNGDNPESIEIRFARTRSMKESTIISPKNDVGMVLEYTTSRDGALKKPSENMILFEYISLPLSNIEHPKVLLRDDGNIYYNRHVVSKYYQEKDWLNIFLEKIDYPKKSFNQIYWRKNEY